MSANDNQIVVYQQNETVRLDVRWRGKSTTLYFTEGVGTFYLP